MKQGYLRAFAMGDASCRIACCRRTKQGKQLCSSQSTHPKCPCLIPGMWILKDPCSCTVRTLAVKDFPYLYFTVYVCTILGVWHINLEGFKFPNSPCRYMEGRRIYSVW